MQFRGVASLLSFSCALAATSALAEEAPRSEVRGRSSAQQTSAVLAVRSGVSMEGASEEQKRSAQDSFLLGDQAFDIQDYQEALGHFSDSYETVASPNSRLMIARCLLEIGRLDEAYEQYSGVMQDAEGNKDYETTGATAKKEREALRHRLAWLTVKMGDVPRGSSLTIGGRERTSSSLEEPIAVTPGRTAVKAMTPEGVKAEATVHLAAGRAADVVLQLGEAITVGEPPPRPRNAVESASLEQQSPSLPKVEKDAPLRPYAYATGGVGLLGVLGFATFGTLSKSRYSSLEEDCTQGVCPASSQRDIDSGKQMQRFANISLGVGAAGVFTSVLLFALDARKHRPVDVQVGYRNVMLRGTF